MDYDKRSGYSQHYWQKFPEIPLPHGYTFLTDDGRRALDYCTKIGFPIIFQMEEGRVTQVRSDRGVLDILITKGDGIGLYITYGHIDHDRDPKTPEIESLKVGDIVKFGDIIGYTGIGGKAPGEDTSTQVGIFNEINWLRFQRMMIPPSQFTAFSKIIFSALNWMSSSVCTILKFIPLKGSGTGRRLPSVTGLSLFFKKPGAMPSMTLILGVRSIRWWVENRVPTMRIF